MFLWETYFALLMDKDLDGSSGAAIDKMWYSIKFLLLIQGFQ